MVSLTLVRVWQVNFRRFLHESTYNKTTTIRGRTLRNIFCDKKWALEPLKFPDLPNDEVDTNSYQPINVNFSKIPLDLPNFKDLLNSSLSNVYNNKLTSRDHVESNMRKMAWLQLRNYIYQKLKNPEELRSQIKNFSIELSQYIEPSRPDDLIPLLVNLNNVSEITWKSILESTESIDDASKFTYLLNKIFDHIYASEVLPRSLETIDTDDINAIDISNPTEWFPEARKMKRHIIMHLGPTNSGKTYRALQRLKQADRGYYCGPLRLLAREVYDRFKSEGYPCNLLTGEEVIDDLDSLGNKAGLTSGTVEMVSLSKPFDVIVLDEIQMMGDEDRGWAWTNVLLGARSKEIHVCGEKSVLPIIKKIINITGDKLTINEYERLGDLIVEKEALMNNFKKLKRGDCVVAFSKKLILDLKLKIERETNLKVAVIYGSLPPETRVQQASLFNSGEYDVLVASDAIGMGLNLSIDRIIFTADTKFNGQDMTELSSSNIKQIGGRAGRFKSDKNKRSKGYITAMSPDILQSIKKGIEAPIEYLKKVVIWPTDEICAKLMIRYPPKTRISFLLETFEKQLDSSSEKMYALSGLKNKLTIMRLFEEMENISFFDKLRLSTAPVKDNPFVKKAFIEFCKTIATRSTRGLLSYRFPFHLLDYQCITNEDIGLEQYEALYNVIMIYFWLSNRYPEYFIDTESARDLKYFCELIIFEKLDRLKKNPYLRRRYKEIKKRNGSKSKVTKPVKIVP